MKEEKIVKEGQIWDLHIHTCNCPKGSSDFSNMTEDEYVDLICDNFKIYKPKLISFTDHNIISYDIYKKFADKKTGISFIVGIELDLNIDEDSENSKHVIIYFDINENTLVKNKNNIEKINKLAKKAPYVITKFLSELLDLNIEFIISPHAFKQNERSIEYTWNDENETSNNISKYSDQFFCFWEASGVSQIARAIEFLKDFDCENKISIVSFSDANSINKLKQYLENPTQYFFALPTFKGLKMVGSDISRIRKEKEPIRKDDINNYIEKIKFDDNDIVLSNKLNTIIGGRGSGKSLLLDGIANKLEIELKCNNTRKTFINNYDIKLITGGGIELNRKNIKVDYYSQSYVSDLFSDKDYNNNLKNYFGKEYTKIVDIDKDNICSDYLNQYKLKLLNNVAAQPVTNLGGLLEKYIKIDNEKIKTNWKLDKKVTKLGYEDVIDKIKNRIDLVIPKEIINDPIIKEKEKDFLKIILMKYEDYNNLKYYSYNIKKLLIDNYKEYKTNSDEKNKNKIKLEDSIKEHLEYYKNDYIKRVNIINSLLEMQNIMKFHYEKELCVNGEIENRFRFTKELDIEKPIEFLMRKFNEYFKKSNCSTIEKGIYYYCFESNKELKDEKTLENLDLELISFNLNYNVHNEVYVCEDSKYENIHMKSPGTQANYLMEYLVYKDVSIPLLIDQPEDNIDNQTIYDKLTTWFRKLKRSRQVIVVTHDANIVINSDAENVVIAKNSSDNKFKYSCGALEYNDNLEQAANILDGGKQAIKRRMNKYGE